MFHADFATVPLNVSLLQTLHLAMWNHLPHGGPGETIDHPSPLPLPYEPVHHLIPSYVLLLCLKVSLQVLEVYCPYWVPSAQYMSLCLFLGVALPFLICPQGMSVTWGLFLPCTQRTLIIVISRTFLPSLSCISMKSPPASPPAPRSHCSGQQRRSPALNQTADKRVAQGTVTTRGSTSDLLPLPPNLL